VDKLYIYVIFVSGLLADEGLNKLLIVKKNTMNTVEKKSMPVWLSILLFAAIMAAIMIIGMTI